MASKTVLKAPKSVRVGKRAVVRIKVSASGIASPTGVVKIYAGRKLVAKVRLKAGAVGAAKVRLARLAAGRYKLTCRLRRHERREGLDLEGRPAQDRPLKPRFQSFSSGSRPLQRPGTSATTG